MKTRDAVLAVLGLAIGTTACGRGCTCFSGEKTYEKLDGKYEVSLVRKTHWTGGRIPGPISNFYIHVDTAPPIDEPIGDCTHADMKEDKEGKFVGFRCRDTHEKEWTVLRLRGGDRRIRECGATVGTDDTPNWSKLESVRASTTRVLGCPNADHSYAMEQLAHAVLEDEGSRATAEYLTTLASLGHASFPDPWDSAFRIVDDATRSATLSKLCPTLANGKAAYVPYVRAARHCPLDTSGALSMFRTAIDDPNARAIDVAAAVVWSGLLAAKSNPKETGEIACQVLSAPHPIDWPVTHEALLAELLGQTNTKCASAVSNWVESPPCNFLLDCDGGLCSAPELATDLDGWYDGLDAGVRPDPTVPHRDRAVLRAMYAAGPLPKEITLPNERRRYAMPDASVLPYCSNVEVEAGAECLCGIGALELCSVSADAAVVERTDCTMRIDDRHHRLETGRRVCEALGASCRTHPCCGDALCQNDICARRPTPDAGARD